MPLGAFVPSSGPACARPRPPRAARRVVTCVGLWLLAAVVCVLAHAAEVIRRSFDLPADALERSLKRYAEQAETEVLFSTDAVAGERTQPVRGELTPREALERMLAGTRFAVFHEPRTGALTLVRRDGPATGPAGARGKPGPSGAETKESMKKPPLVVRIGGAIALLFSSTAQAADPTGTIAGRVYNPATKEYVRNAEVRVDGTNLVTYTESDGSFQFGNIAAGPTAVSVSYSGYQPVTERITVEAGATVTREIRISSTAPGGRSQDGTIRLQEFVVSSEREGNAKAIMEQRRNMNVTTSVASDIFGDVTDGDVGEFLKFLPGVDLDYQESATRGPRLGGMDPQYVGFTIDGVGLASADALRTGDQGRAASFDTMSIVAIEAIEISRTTSPDMDASAPAGTINLKTRRAFDRQGRLVSYNVGLSLNSEEFHLRKTYGPGEVKQYKARPNYKFDYADVFLNRKLGIVASVSRTDSYREQFQNVLAHHKSATDPRPVVVTQIRPKDGSILIMKNTYSLTADYKVSERLALMNTFIYNFADVEWRNRATTLNLATNNTAALTGRNTVVGDGLTDVTATVAGEGAGSLAMSLSNAAKETTTRTWSSKFEYRLPSLLVDGLFSYSGSFNDYEALERGLTRTEVANAIPSTFRATRSSRTAQEWTIRQLSGPDWFDLGSYTNPRITNEGRIAQTEIYTAALNARWTTPLRRFPLTVKFGGKIAEEERNNYNLTNVNTWSYIGPGGNRVTGINAATGVPVVDGLGSWRGFDDPHPYDFGSSRIMDVYDLAGGLRFLPRVDGHRLSQLFRSNPEQFVNIATPANYRDAHVASRRNIEQTVTAGYGMADIRLMPRLMLRAGVRWERTKNVAVEFDPKTRTEMIAAGYPVDANGVATTFNGVAYQYYTNPMIDRKASYDNFFPMVSLKYNPRRDLEVHLGYNHAISRPPPDSLTGTWIINDEAMVVTSPNPNLLPEESKNFAARVAYYFNPAGQVSIGITQNTIRNARITERRSAAEFGIDDPAYDGYEFQSPFNVPTATRHRNLEVGYNQTLPFQSELLRGTTVNVAYTRSYANARRNNLTPHRFSTSIGYRFRKFSSRLGVVWRSDTDTGSTTGQYGQFREADRMVDLSLEYRVHRNVTIYAQGRNIFDHGVVYMDTPTGLKQGTNPFVRHYESYGALWHFGVKGTF